MTYHTSYGFIHHDLGHSKKERKEAKIHRAMSCMEKHSGKLTRVEEIIFFAKTIGAKRIGLAYCKEMHKETQLFSDILEMQGFTTLPISCQKKIDPIASCDATSQAKFLNKLHTDLNITLGLCLGKDALFTYHASAITLCFIAKDTILGHHPLLGLYMTSDFEPRT